MTLALRYGRRDRSAQEVTLAADEGALAIVGQAANLRRSLRLVADAGSVAITGQQATLASEVFQWSNTGPVNLVQGVPYQLAADFVNTTGDDEDYEVTPLPPGVTLDAGVLDVEPSAPLVTGFVADFTASAGAFQNFAQRSTEQGVTRFCGFIDSNDWCPPANINNTPILYPGPDKGIIFNPGWGQMVSFDPSVSASADGSGSLKFTVPANSSSVQNINWWMNFGTVAAPVLFDEGETFYVQWRQLFSQGYTDTNRAGIGGTKTAIICAGDIDGSADAQGNGRENSTACEISQIVLNGGDCFTAHLVNPELVPFGFHRCPADGGTINFEFTISTPFGNAFNVQNARPNYCLRHTNAFYPSRLNPNQTPNPGTCLTIYPSEWMTHKFAITLGPWGLVRQLIPTGGGTPINQYGFQNSRIRFWLGRPGQVSEPVWDFTMGLGTSYVSDFHRGYGKIWFTPRGGGEPVTHPEYYSWYDEVIVSRNDIAEPL